VPFHPHSDLAREVAGQPDDWAAVVARLPELRGSLPAPGARVAVVGCGTSYFVAQAHAAPSGRSCRPGSRTRKVSLRALARRRHCSRVNLTDIADERERVEQALDAVRRDLTETLPDVVNLRIESSEGGTMWVTDDEGSSFGEVLTGREGSSRLLAMVADCAQTVAMDAAGRTWPECIAHHAGLHVTINSDQAEWECRVGGHVVAPIGRLADRA
jgi:hypothetical protein